MKKALSWFRIQGVLFLIIFYHQSHCQHVDATIIQFTTVCTAGKDHLTQTDSVILQINSRSGDHYAEISIPWSDDERLSDVAARIETVDGKKIRDLKKKEIIDRSAISEQSLYEDHYIKSFELKHNVYPYRLFYTYTRTFHNFITYAWWSPVVFRKVPTLLATLRVTIPSDMPYSFYLNHFPEPMIDSTAGSVLLEWKTAYLDPLKDEIFSQPEDAEPYVVIAPRFFKYGVAGSTEDWQSFGNWQYRLLEGPDVLPETEKATISRLIHGVTDKLGVVKILYHYLQDHTRYINVSIGIGGLKPFPASYVALNKYGDCKALTNYMKALLSYAGIESFYTLIYASRQPRKPAKCFASEFNHALLAVPLGNDTIWLENTSNINPFGYVGTSIQNRDALIVSNENSRLVRVPELKKEDVLVLNRLSYDLNVNGDARLAVNSSFKGRNFEKFNQLHTDYVNDDKERIIRDYMPFGNYEVVTWELKKQNRDTARIDLNVVLNVSKVLKSLGNEFYFEVRKCDIPSFEPPAVRSLPVAIPYPIYSIDTLEYDLPAGYGIKTPPDTVEIDTRFGNYRRVLLDAGKKIIVLRKFEVYTGNYITVEYPDFYNFIRSVREADVKKIVIRPAL